MKDLKFSRYAVPVKLDNGDVFLLNGLTGAIDIVDAVTYADVGSNNLNKISEAILNRLERRGHLTTLNEEEELSRFQNIASRLAAIQSKRMSNDFTIVPTYDCNFSCPYCFEHTSAVGKSHGKTMDRRMVDLCFNAIARLTEKELRHSKTIILFGGEPLLAENAEIISYIVAKGNDAGFSFSVVTNGYDLEAFSDLISQGWIKSVQVTMDGDREVHNRRRRHKYAGDTFDRILSNAEMALSLGTSVTMRINVDAENKDRISALVETLKSRGVYGRKGFGIYVSFISGDENFNPANYDCSSNYICYDEFFERAMWLDAEIGVETALSRRLRSAIETKSAFRLSPFNCGVDSCSYILDPFGRIYGCLSFVGDNDKAIGSYLSGEIVISKNTERRKTSRLQYVERCGTCEYGLLCGGGCAALKNTNCKKDFADRLKTAVAKAIQTNLIHY